MMTTAFVVPGVERGATAAVDIHSVSGGSRTTAQRDNNSLCPGWRVALNFGPSSFRNNNPLDHYFGTSSTTRLPVVIPCDFTNEGLVIPRSDTCSYTVLEGGVVKPVQGGYWKMIHSSRNGGDKKNNMNNNEPITQTLQFTLKFPEELQKNDVVIPAQSTIFLEGLVYSQDTLKDLDEAFLTARSQESKAQEALDAIYKVRDGPKQWNQERQVWERPTLDVPLTELWNSHWTVWSKRLERQRRNAARPNKNSQLSQQAGPFPGYVERVYMGTQGVIRLGPYGKVVGSWSAEPLNHVPASYLASR